MLSAYLAKGISGVVTFIEQRDSQGCTCTSEWDTTDPAQCPRCHPPSSCPPYTPPWPSHCAVFCNRTCLKLSELQKAEMPGWVVFANSALPPAASPFLENHLEAASTPPATHPQATGFNHSGQLLSLPAGNPYDFQSFPNFGKYFRLSSSKAEHGRRRAVGRRGSGAQDASVIHLPAGCRKQRLLKE